MDMRIPPLKVDILLESNPLKSRILVLLRRLAVLDDVRSHVRGCITFSSKEVSIERHEHLDSDSGSTEVSTVSWTRELVNHCARQNLASSLGILFQC